MKIYLGSDHAGFSLKQAVKAYLVEKGYDAVDMGAPSLDPNDDYPDFIAKVAAAISLDGKAKGIVFGGTGQAEAITANKYTGVRCALFYGPVMAKDTIDVNGATPTDAYDVIRLARVHNDTNMLSLGARFLTVDEAIHAITLWLETPFGEEERHKRRLAKIAIIEKTL